MCGEVNVSSQPHVQVLSELAKILKLPRAMSSCRRGGNCQECLVQKLPKARCV